MVTSKSFTTTETLANLKRAVQWLADAGIDSPYEQVVAITARPEAATKLGIPGAQVFQFWIGWVAAIRCGRPSACPWRWQWVWR